MNFIRLLPVIVSFLMIGAHFMRSGHVALAAISVLMPVLLLVRTRWIPPLFSVLLTLAACEWLRTLYFLAAMRVAWGQPWGRMALILGSVAAFTALSMLVFRTRKLKAFYDGAGRD